MKVIGPNFPVLPGGPRCQQGATKAGRGCWAGTRGLGAASGAGWLAQFLSTTIRASCAWRLEHSLESD